MSGASPLSFMSLPDWFVGIGVFLQKPQQPHSQQLSTTLAGLPHQGHRIVVTHIRSFPAASGPAGSRRVSAAILPLSARRAGKALYPAKRALSSAGAACTNAAAGV